MPPRGPGHVSGVSCPVAGRRPLRKVDPSSRSGLRSQSLSTIFNISQNLLPPRPVKILRYRTFFIKYVRHRGMSSGVNSNAVVRIFTALVQRYHTIPGTGEGPRRPRGSQTADSRQAAACRQQTSCCLQTADKLLPAHVLTRGGWNECVWNSRQSQSSPPKRGLPRGARQHLASISPASRQRRPQHAFSSRFIWSS